MNTCTISGGSDVSLRPLQKATKRPRSRSYLLLAALCALSLTVPKVHAVTAYDESVSGDLSNNGLAPTVIALQPGWNAVFGTTGRGANGVDRDYFTFNVPTNFVVSSFDELAGTQIGGAVSFLGLEQGTELTLPTNTTTAAGLFGWTHYGATSVDIDLLPALGIPSDGSTGFSGPLLAGDYSVWIQDFNTGPIPYGFAVQLSSVPEPSTYGIFASALLAAVAFVRRKFQRAS